MDPPPSPAKVPPSPTAARAGMGGMETEEAAREEGQQSTGGGSGGGGVEGGGSPRKRRKLSPERRPLLKLAPIPSEFPPPSFIPFDPTRRSHSAPISSLINPPTPDLPIRANRGSPSRAHVSPSSLSSLLINSPSFPASSFPASSSLSDPAPSSRLPEIISPVDIGPRPHSRSSLTPAPWPPRDPRNTAHSVSPVPGSDRSRPIFPSPASQLVSLPPTGSQPSRRAASVAGSMRIDEPTTPCPPPDSPPLRERSRRSLSSGPSRSERRGNPSNEASRAWFSLGPMEAVDMRQWDQHQREAYQRGYTDALKAVQGGTVGVAGVQCEWISRLKLMSDPRPQLLKKDETMPSEERYRSISSRRPSIHDSSRSFYPEASARVAPPPSPHWQSRDRPPPHHYPSSQMYEQAPPHHQSTSAWADDRRAEYARYKYTVPQPPHADPPHRPIAPLAPGGPYYPAPHPRHYSFADHPTYGSNPTSSNPTTGTASTSPSQTRPGQRQLISCYPCRSRKMKCDGTKPCFQCTRRGGEAECEFAVTVRRRGKGKKPSTGEMSTGKSGSGSDGEGGESGQESGDELWRIEGMNLPDVDEERV